MIIVIDESLGVCFLNRPIVYMHMLMNFPHYTEKLQCAVHHHTCKNTK